MNLPADLLFSLLLEPLIPQQRVDTSKPKAVTFNLPARVSYGAVESVLPGSPLFRLRSGLSVNRLAPLASSLVFICQWPQRDLQVGNFRALTERGHMMRGGSIVDATLINAPSSTKNEKRERDPEMHQTKKGNDCYFGMKCHVGVDAGSGYVHSLETIAANVHDITMTTLLIRKDDKVVYGDSGYIGIEKRDEVKSSPHLSMIEYRINRRHHSVQRLPDGCIDWEKQIERRKSSVRSKVEHPFLFIKRYFGFARTVYRGLAKNTHRLHTLFASTNLLMYARAGRSLRPA